MQAHRKVGSGGASASPIMTELDTEAFNECLKIEAVPLQLVGNGRSMAGGMSAPVGREEADRLSDVFNTEQRKWWPVLPPGAFYVQNQGLLGSEPNILKLQRSLNSVSIQTCYWQRTGPHALGGLMSQPMVVGALADRWAAEKQQQLNTVVKLYWDRSANTQGTDYVTIFDIGRPGAGAASRAQPAASQRVHMQSFAMCRPSGSLHTDDAASGGTAKHRKAQVVSCGAWQRRGSGQQFDFKGWGDGYGISYADTKQAPKTQPSSLAEGLACGCSTWDPDNHIPEPISTRAAGSVYYNQWGRSSKREVVTSLQAATQDSGDGAPPRVYTQFPFYSLSLERNTFMTPQSSGRDEGSGGGEDEEDGVAGEAQDNGSTHAPVQMATVKVPSGVWFYTADPASGSVEEALEVPWEHPFHTAPSASLTAGSLGAARDHFSLWPAGKPGSTRSGTQQSGRQPFTPSPVVLSEWGVGDVVAAYQECLTNAGMERGQMFSDVLGTPAISGDGQSWARRLHYLRHASSLEYAAITARCRLLEQLMALPDMRLHCPEVGSVLWHIVSNVKALTDTMQLADTEGFRAGVRPNDCILVTRCLDLMPMSSWALNPGQSNETDLKTAWRELVGQHGLHKKMAGPLRGAGLCVGIPAEVPSTPKKAAKAAKGVLTAVGEETVSDVKPRKSAPSPRTAKEQGTQLAQAAPTTFQPAVTEIEEAAAPPRKSKATTAKKAAQVSAEATPAPGPASVPPPEPPSTTPLPAAAPRRKRVVEKEEEAQATNTAPLSAPDVPAARDLPASSASAASGPVRPALPVIQETVTAAEPLPEAARFKQPLRLQSARPAVAPVHVPSPTGQAPRTELELHGAAGASPGTAGARPASALRPLPPPGAPDLASPGAVADTVPAVAAVVEAPKARPANDSKTEQALGELLDKILVKHRFRQQCEEAKLLAGGASGLQGALSWFEMRVNKAGDEKGPTGLQPSTYYKKFLQSRDLPAVNNTTQNARQLARTIFEEWFGTN